DLGTQDTLPGPPLLPPLGTTTDSQQKVFDNLNINNNILNPPTTPVVLNTQDIVNLLQGGQQGQSGQQGQGAPQGGPRGGPANTPPPGQLNVGPGRFFFIPPPGETRHESNRFVLEADSSIPLAQLQAIFAQLGVTVIASQPVGLLGKTMYQLEFTSGLVHEKISQAATFDIFSAGAPSYVFFTTQDVAGRGETGRGDAAQYMLTKLSLPDLHRTFKGTNIPIAVIDSEIDAEHPDLAGVIVDRYNATGVDEKPHPHGTGMAGAIGSHRRLVGTAPAAHLLAIRAFSSKASAAESTTFN